MEHKKLEGNGLWESSRMILPEHKRRIMSDNHEELRRDKPILDAQEWELIDRALFYSQQEKAPVTLKLFDPFDDRIAKGIVLAVDRQLKRIKLLWSADDWDWIEMDEILSAWT
ncbi:YolD-like protein [compost metagenome]